MHRRIRRFTPLALILLGLLAGPSVLAQDAVVAPDEIPGSTKVGAEGVIKLAGHVPNLRIIDARIRMDRRQGYIEGSISLPNIETDCDSLAEVVPHKTTPVLFYCNGPKCGRSVISVRRALECGYTDVYWFRGGFEEWKQSGYPFLKE